MKNKAATLFRILGIIIGSFVFMQCELILGAPDNANVGIDLSAFLDNAGNRAISSQYTATEIHISVFGPGMQPIEKIVSPNIPSRTVNMYVPSGADRHFTVEVFIVPDATHPHVLSYKGRAIADLRPGRYLGLKIRMVAGATALLVEDPNGGRIYQGNDIAFTPYIFGSFGFTAGFSPTTLDIDNVGRIFVINGTDLSYADSIAGGNVGSIRVGTPTAIAIDRDCYFNINPGAGSTVETSILYVGTSTGALGYSIIDDTTLNPPVPAIPTPMNSSGLTAISGLAVDPWTHYIYLVGTNSTGNPAISEYDPTFSDANFTAGRIIRTIDSTTVSTMKTLKDIIVKDDGIFVLNNPALTEKTIPIVLEFDSNLTFLQGFGNVSSDAIGRQFVPSVNVGQFYRPKRFFAHENDGLYIIDDSTLSDSFNGDYDKLVFLNTELDPASWRTFPTTQVLGSPSGEPFFFFE